MTYEQNKRRIAERLAKKYQPIESELAIIDMMPFAEICLEEMAEQFKCAYNIGWTNHARGYESPPTYSNDLLTQNGLIP